MPPLSELGSDKSPSQITSVSGAIPATSTPIALTSPSRNIVISLTAASALVSVRLDGGIATSANFTINAGGQLVLTGLPLVSTVTIIGASALGNYSILAY